MGCYRRLISDAFRRYNWNVEKCVSRNSFSSTSDPRRSGLGISQPIFRKSDLQNVVFNNYQRKSPFVAKRFYSADVKPMGYRHWYQNPIISLVTLGLLGGAVVIPVYYWNSEKVPYTNRGTFVLFPTSLEKKRGENQLKFNYKGKILGSDHPESIRFAKIGKDIIGALRKKLDDDEKTMHLKEFNWDIVVVDDPTAVTPKCSCLPDGMIVVSTSLLKYLKTDDEIAFAIGREVGHVVARHEVEGLTAFLWLAMSSFSMAAFTIATSDFLPWPLLSLIFTRETAVIYLALCFFLMIFFCSGNEMEADYIGLLLSASAGYDPRIAPEVCEKLGKFLHSYDLYGEKCSQEVEAKWIAQKLSEPKVMEEALAIYRETLNDNDKDPNLFKEKEKEGQLTPQQTPI